MARDGGSRTETVSTRSCFAPSRCSPSRTRTGRGARGSPPRAPAPIPPRLADHEEPLRGRLGRQEVPRGRSAVQDRDERQAARRAGLAQPPPPSELRERVRHRSLPFHHPLLRRTGGRAPDARPPASCDAHEAPHGRRAWGPASVPLPLTRPPAPRPSRARSAKEQTSCTSSRARPGSRSTSSRVRPWARASRRRFRRSDHPSNRPREPNPRAPLGAPGPCPRAAGGPPA